VMPVAVVVSQSENLSEILSETLSICLAVSYAESENLTQRGAGSGSAGHAMKVSPKHHGGPGRIVPADPLPAERAPPDKKARPRVDLDRA
jgi:hypothetical protein